MSSIKEVLHELLKLRLSPEGLTWLENAHTPVGSPVRESALMGYYAGAGRRMGKAALALDQGERLQVRELDEELILDHWGADEAARALLLLSLDHLPEEAFMGIAGRAYELGDSREQTSWLRAAILLPNSERFLATAVDACRTNILSLFEAIACENPYPARYFPDANFNQLLMKCLFNGLAIARVVGLGRRLNTELSRMANDYVDEREAAGREVPSDIWLALAPHVDSEGVPRVHSYLSHEDPDHRYWAAVGLGTRPDGEGRQALQERLRIEEQPRVRDAIDAALAENGNA
jgi:hypothetical protein